MNYNKIKLALTVLLTLSICFVYAQAPENWFNLDYEKDGVRGVSTERVYKELIKGKTGKTVIVAVIDSGVDEEHEDLQAVMWVNEDEIPNNGIDDDKNGYVDDINGWNFLGGKDGRNVNEETLEVTRVYAHLRKKYEKLETTKGLSKKEKKEYKLFKKVKEEVETKRGEAQMNLQMMAATVTMYEEAMNRGKELLAGEKLNDATIAKIEKNAVPDDLLAIKLLKAAAEQKISFDEFRKEVAAQIKQGQKYYKSQADYMYNPDWNPRKDIIKDDYSNSYEKGYGNNDVQGPDAGHGTHVAGIIGAIRDNNLGMKGVANNVRIMSLRAVPDGDEHDKDIANAIIYAVDNGASVINMSFGKSYGWDKNAVDKAVKYARKKDVLLVHAAGNSALNIDVSPNFPNDRYDKKGWFCPRYADNWLEIGALSWKKGEDALAVFSNYGKTNVDVFAPGVDIYSTVPDKDAYDTFSGTSMASPVTAGVAALLRSYFPKLTAKQVKEIIMKSSVKLTGKVKIPGSEETVPMKEVCISGGVVNAYKAFQLAAETKGKKKIKKPKA